jgi:3-hydroxyisobutyrate dehydrogenase
MPDALVPGTAVAFFGLGRMGTPMTRRLLAAGYDVRGYDVEPGALEAFAEASGRTAPESPAAALDGAAALVLMLPDSKAVGAALTADVLAALPPGALVVDMGSSDPMQTRELATRLGRRGLDVVDAPVSGGVTGAEAGSLTIMVGGDDAAFARCRPLLDELGGNILHVGGSGAGHALKALNNLHSATHLLSSVEVLRVGRRFGLDPETMVAAINTSTGRSWSTEHKLPRFVIPETYTSGFALRLMAKDVQIALELAEATGASMPLGAAAGALWAEAAGELAGDADHTEIARWVEESYDGHPIVSRP